MDVLMIRKAVTYMALAFPLWLSSENALGAETEVGVAAYVIRDVQGSTTDNAIRKISVKDSIYHNEVISTSANSSAQLLFPDETSLTIGPSSELRIDSMVFDPTGDKSALSIDVTTGVFHFISGHLPKKAYSISTPFMQIGVRGTVFDLVVETTGESTVVLQEGVLEISAGAAGGMTLDVPGLSTTTSAGIPAPSPPAPPSPKIMQQIEQVNNPAVVLEMATPAPQDTQAEAEATSSQTIDAPPVDSQTVSEVSDDPVTLSHNTHGEPL